MTTRRIFVAIKITNTNQIREIFRQVQLELKDEWIKWVDRRGLHITLSFLGATDVRKIPLIKNRLKACADKIPSFQLQLKSVGAFPSVGKAKIIWLGVEAGDIIFELKDEIVKQLELVAEIGDKRFSPHLTMGRIKHGIKNPERVKQVLEFHASWKDEPLTIKEFVLMESKLTPTGPIYKVMDTFRLKC